MGREGHKKEAPPVKEMPQIRGSHLAVWLTSFIINQIGGIVSSPVDQELSERGDSMMILMSLLGLLQKSILIV
jgi:hypothetical protein